jgi:amino acid permease
MKIFAYFLAVVCLVIAVMYYVLPGGSLPQFLPGYDAGSTHIHTMHAIAAATAAIVFLLIGLSSGRRRRKS